MRPSRIARSANFALLIAIVAGCAGGGTDAPITQPCVVTAVSVSPSSGSVTVGDGQQLTSTASASNCTSTVATWSSSNQALATVSSNGLVTGVAVGGPVVISATVEGKIGTASLQVVAAAISTITLSATNTTLVETNTAAVTAVTKDARGNTLTGRTLTWSSSDASIVSVDGSGNAIAAAPGTATITAKDAANATVLGTLALTVTPGVVATMAFTSTSISANTNDAALTASVIMRNAAGLILKSQPVQWTTSDFSVTLPTPPSWTACGAEGGTCVFSGTKLVRFGNDQYFLVQVATNNRSCNVGSFTIDPLPNLAKTCYFADLPVTSTGSTPVRAIGPGTANLVATLASNTTITAQLPVTVGNFGGYVKQFLVIVGTPRAGETFTIQAQRYDALGYNVTPFGAVQTIGTDLVSLGALVNRSADIIALAQGTLDIQFLPSSTGAGPTDAITVTIAPPTIPVATVQASIVSNTIAVGATSNVSAVSRDASNNILANRLVRWTSSNTAVATVARTGPGFGVRGIAPGTAIITATVEGKTSTVSVTVPLPAARLAYAMVNGNTLATTPEFTANAMGGTVSVTRVTTGSFDVSFTNMAPVGFDATFARVTSADGAYCYTNDTRFSGTTETVNVLCRAAPYTVETPTNNASFSVLVTGASAFPGRSDFYNTQGNLETTLPTDGYWYTSTGGTISIFRSSRGVFNASTGLFPRPGGLTGAAEATLVGAAGAFFGCAAATSATSNGEITECYAPLDPAGLAFVNGPFNSITVSAGRAGTGWAFTQFSPNPLFDRAPYTAQSVVGTTTIVATASGQKFGTNALPATGARFLQIGQAGGGFGFRVCGYGVLDIAAGTYEVICRDRTGAINPAGFTILLGQ